MIVDAEGAVEALAAGAVIAIPTDTVYGLAVDPRLREATGRLFALKGRPDDVALPVLVADVEAALRLGRLGIPGRRLADRCWPGALTVVVARARAATGYELGGDPRSIGLRCPAHAAVRTLLRRTGPLAVSSANRHGEAPCRSAEDVTAAFGHDVPVVDGGTCEGVPSTVVRLDPSGLQCLREGALALADLERIVRETG